MVGFKEGLGHAAGQLECVNPWELESDPDFERTEGERQREQEAEARALRAQAIALRRHATSFLAPLLRQLLCQSSSGIRHCIHSLNWLSMSSWGAGLVIGACACSNIAGYAPSHKRLSQSVSHSITPFLSHYGCSDV